MLKLSYQHNSSIYYFQNETHEYQLKIGDETSTFAVHRYLTDEAKQERSSFVVTLYPKGDWDYAPYSNDKTTDKNHAKVAVSQIKEIIKEERLLEKSKIERGIEKSKQSINNYKEEIEELEANLKRVEAELAYYQNLLEVFSE